MERNSPAGLAATARSADFLRSHEVDVVDWGDVETVNVNAGSVRRGGQATRRVADLATDLKAQRFHAGGGVDRDFQRQNPGGFALKKGDGDIIERGFKFDFRWRRCRPFAARNEAARLEHVELSRAGPSSG